jgi:hypothetical protein
MIAYCLSFSFEFVVTLTVANARISALEAELNAAREAWEVSNAANVSAEKIAKSAETKAKKAKKALADADQRQIQHEQSIAARLYKISVTVGSKCRVVLFFATCFRLVFLLFVYFLLLVSLRCSRENWSILETAATRC